MSCYISEHFIVIDGLSWLLNILNNYTEYEQHTISYTLDAIDILSGVHELLTTQHIADLIPALKKLIYGVSDGGIHQEVTAILCNIHVSGELANTVAEIIAHVLSFPEADAAVILNSLGCLAQLLEDNEE